jgi:NTE family protein
MNKSSMKTVSLVLGGGGARGLAHIGIIRWLEENNYQIKSVSGCSIGALVGGIYATGKLDEFENWVRAIRRIDIVSLLDISWSRGGLIKGDKIIETLVHLVGDQLIEELPIRYTAVATDIDNEKEVWINSGRLFDAIRASISLPLFFTPFKRNGVLLIDGGVLNPVPIAPTFNDSTDMTIAINLGGEAEQIEQIQAPQPDETSGLHEKISRYIDDLQSNFSNSIELESDIYDVAQRSFDAMQSTIARQKLAAYPPDYIIELPSNICSILEFERASEIIERGYMKAQEKLGTVLQKQ